jgi:toxin ParE1/3/4
MATYGFHPEALAEYKEAAKFYLEHASPLIAASFIAEVETSISKVLIKPGIWRVVEAPDIRRYLMHQFPYALYYRWESIHNRVAIYAVMHLRREPGYWKHRTAVTP